MDSAKLQYESELSKHKAFVAESKARYEAQKRDHRKMTDKLEESRQRLTELKSETLLIEAKLEIQKDIETYHENQNYIEYIKKLKEDIKAIEISNVELYMHHKIQNEEFEKKHQEARESLQRAVEASTKSKMKEVVLSIQRQSISLDVQIINDNSQ